MEYLDIGPIANAAGRVRIPGSKSISNRVLLLAALADGETVVRDALESDDTGVMITALKQLGVDVRQSGGEIRIKGCGGRFPSRAAELFLGNAGTAFRPLTAALAFMGGEYRLDGVARMHERPIADLVDGLAQIGARVDYLGENGYPPLLLHAADLKTSAPVSVRGDVSSQFLSALLMAAPLGGSAMEIRVVGDLISKPYVEITLNMMRRFGIDAVRHGWSAFTVPAARYQSPGEVFVEGDASSASYFLAAGAISGLSGGGPVRVEGVGRGSIQGDVRFAETLESMGALVTMGDNWIETSAGPEALAAGKLRPLDADLNHIPDAAMTAAVAALFASGPSTLRNIASWRVKETDRIAAMAAELRKLGAIVEEGPDSLRITPPAHLRPATIDTYDDHRMAMCFSLAALGGVKMRINDPACVSKTFPGYFDALGQIVRSRA